ncbi:MAG TPA: YlxM family DNA-binding protein [Firmicutes bacterium]|nr:YlxM family DNA-binding protein [Bacillota bacterium]
MEKTLEQTLLFDFYDELLTDKQREIFRLYYHEDLSFGEIAEMFHISRQGVYDILKRAKGQILELEGKLKLVQRYRHNQRVKERMLVSLQQLTDLLHDREAEVPRDLYETVERTLEQLQEDIRSVDADQERGG